MRVVTFKASKSKILLTITLLVVAVGVAIGFGVKSTTAKTGGQQNLRAATAADRLNFLTGFGWEAAEDPLEVKEVLIPNEFDDTYTNYNEIQKAQGFDLSKYKGCRVKRWTYLIRNFPGYETKDCIHANLLVYEDQIIGGDVCSVELSGFMQGFQKLQTETVPDTKQ